MAPVVTWCRPPARSPPFIQSLATANNKCRPPARESSGARRPRGHGHPMEPAHAGVLRLCRAGVTPVVRAVRGAVSVGAPGVPPACAGVPPTGSTRGSATRCAARPCGSSTEPIELGHKTTYCRLRGSPPCPTPARSCLSPCGQPAESSVRIDDLRARRLLPARAGVLRGPSPTTSLPGCTHPPVRESLRPDVKVGDSVACSPLVRELSVVRLLRQALHPVQLACVGVLRS